MSEATLKFNLPEDRADFHQACAARDMWCAIQAYDDWLRSKVKYADAKDSPERTNTIDVCRTQLYTMLHEYGIELWE